MSSARPPGFGSRPARLEGRLHPLAVLFIARRFVGASLIPVAALLLSLGTRVLVPLLLAGLFIGVPLAILSWMRFRWRLAGDRLELRSGVVSRNVRTIPRERVRGVDVSASFVHRLLGLVRVEIEVASGGGRGSAELTLAAVSRTEAEALREALLVTEPGAAVGAPEPLYRASPGLLALGGITSMRYLLAPAAAVGVLLNVADDIPGGLAERAGEALVDRAPADVVGILALAVAAALATLLAAAAGSLLVDWDFSLADEGERLATRRGLLTHRVVLLDRERIRGTDLRDTPLRRPLKLASVNAIVAGLRGRPGGATLAPVLSTAAAGRLVRAVDPLAPDPALPLVPHPRAALPRRLVRALPAPLALTVLAGFAWPWWGIGAAAALAVVAAAVALDRWRQLGHAFHGGRLLLQEGSLVRRRSELDPGAAVTYELRSSPGQRRAGLCTLEFHLGEGAGSRRALDIGADQAAALVPDLHPAFAELVGPAA